MLMDFPSATQTGIKCATFGASRIEDRNLAVGDYNGGLTIIDLQSLDTSSLKPKSAEIFSVQAHTGIVNAVDGIGGSSHGYGAPEIVTGGRDGFVRIWDPRINEPVVTLAPCPDSTARDCWAVCFGNCYNDEERCVCAGFDNGDVKLFDLRTNSLRWETNCKNGVTCLQFDRNDIPMNKLAVTTLESKFRCYDMRTQHATDGFTHLEEKAHRSTVWVSKHLPQNRDIFVTGGGNGGLNLYKYHYPANRTKKHESDGLPIGVVGSVELLNSRVIATQPIVSLDWSPDKMGLCCLSSLDQAIRYVCILIVVN
jgi:WD40 repeat protein